MPKLKFRDLAKKKNFTTDKYTIIAKNTRAGVRYFAVATAPSGNKAYRIVSKDFYKKYK